MPTTVRAHPRRGTRGVRRHLRLDRADHARGKWTGRLIDVETDLPIGEIVYWTEGPVGVLYNLYIRPEYRGKGFGSAALKIVESDLKNAGARRVVIDEPTEEGLTLYERRGYRWLRRSHENPGGEQVFDMTKRLR